MEVLPNFAQALPELFLIVAGMVFLLVGVYRPADSTGLVTWLSIAAMAVAAGLVHRLHGMAATTFGGLFTINEFTSFAKYLTLGGAAVTLIMVNSWAHMTGTKRFEMQLLALFATAGMMLMISANDLIALYAGLELQSL